MRLVHSELGGFLHSDDTDFTDDGLAEVFMYKYKGKVTDTEAFSSCSLFEIEKATPMQKVGSKEKPKADTNRNDPNFRTGQVFKYSKLGGQDHTQLPNN